jgi:cytosine/creatinine deaminase
MANLYANVAQIGGSTELASCFEMVTALPAKLMNLRDYGVTVGHSADLCSTARIGLVLSPKSRGYCSE